MKNIIAATAIALLVTSPAFAHKKKEKHVECLFNEVYDAETNTCKLIDTNDSFVDTVDNSTDTDNNSGDTHHHGRGHEIGRGHFEHGNGKGLGHYK